MKNIFTSAALAAVLALGTTAASAAVVMQASFSGSGGLSPAPAAPVNTTIVANNNYTEIFAAIGSETLEATFTADGPLRVLGVSFTANGTAANVAKTSLAFNGGSTVAFTPLGNPNASTGSFGFGGFNLLDGQTFTYFLTFDNVSSTVSTTAFFETAAIPVPAALPLLVGGIAALGAVSRKKKKS